MAAWSTQAKMLTTKKILTAQRTDRALDGVAEDLLHAVVLAIEKMQGVQLHFLVIELGEIAKNAADVTQSVKLVCVLADALDSSDVVAQRAHVCWLNKWARE
jgi:hypothetical protein